jgi:hypothetical protein
MVLKLRASFVTLSFGYRSNERSTPPVIPFDSIMENDQMIDPPESDTPQPSKESTTRDSTSNKTVSEVKPEESKREGLGDDESIDESSDTASRTSTRLIKFQLFETKAVRFHIPTVSNSSVSISSDPIRMKVIIESSKSTEQSNPVT